MLSALNRAKMAVSHLECAREHDQPHVYASRYEHLLAAQRQLTHAQAALQDDIWDVQGRPDPNPQREV